jgi:lipopolysaccharide/colanic/teichoic acid biosynthesis glycosyltransferase
MTSHLIGYIYVQTHSTVNHAEFVMGLSVTMLVNGISASKQKEACSNQPRHTEVHNFISKGSGSPNICTSIH